jgi:hypothetical protein
MLHVFSNNGGLESRYMAYSLLLTAKIKTKDPFSVTGLGLPVLVTGFDYRFG